MRSQVQIPKKDKKTLGDFFLFVLALVDKVAWKLLFCFLEVGGYLMDLVVVRARWPA